MRWQRALRATSKDKSFGDDDREMNANQKFDASSQTPLYQPLMSRNQRVEYLLFVALMLSALLFFWKWWLEPSHNINTIWFVLSTLALAWVSLMPLYLIFIFGRSRIVSKSVALPRDLRVAMVVTKAPSEPFSVVRETLIGMLRQRHPHDTWLADEDPSEATMEWCRQHGVLVSCRKDSPDYHNDDWPRRTRCKEGNLAYFYDHFGYENYDVVVQLDADHVPEEGYLAEMLRPFVDPNVGYVSAPSICDSNAHESWSARGRLYAEAGLHGPLQAGYSGGFAPLCIGSHYAVRTVALKDIGGLGPELAEDHSTTLMMNAHGWRGVHAIDAIAHGRGPDTFPDLITQEFQWSRSLMTILLRYTPKYFRALPAKTKIQFAFAELWYPIFSVMMLLMFCLPILALISDKNLVSVSYPEFFARFFTIWAMFTLIAVRWKRHKFVRPFDTKVFSWESTLFFFARWPWSLIGTLCAIKDCITGTTPNFKITKKANDGTTLLPMKIFAPYVFLLTVSGVPAILLDVENARGFYFFATLNSIIYATLILVILLKHWQENPFSRSRMLCQSQPASRKALLGGLVTSAIVIPLIAIPLRMPDAVSALMWKYDSLIDPYYMAAVAAGGPESQGEQKSSDQTRPVELGVYDPESLFSYDSRLSIEHKFVPWQVDDAGDRVKAALRQASNQGRRLLLTLEPFTKAINWRDGADQLFGQVVAGAYDDQIHAICKEIGKSEAEVWVRWGHEMETPIERYPWAQNDPAAYVNAFRHVVQKCRSSASNALYVWSPKGERGLEAFCPGDEFVDLVGFSVYGMQAWETYYYGKPRSAIENIWEKYNRVSRYNKPIIVAELGVYGDNKYSKGWVENLQQKIEYLPLVKAVVYFNDKEPHVWPQPYGAPDWRVYAPLLFAALRETSVVTSP